MLPTGLFLKTIRLFSLRRRAVSWKTKITQLKNFHEFKEYEQIHIYDSIVFPCRKFELSGESSLFSFILWSNCRLLLTRDDDDDKTWWISVRFFSGNRITIRKFEGNVTPWNGFLTGMRDFRASAVSGSLRSKQCTSNQYLQKRYQFSYSTTRFPINIITITVKSEYKRLVKEYTNVASFKIYIKEVFF